VSPSDRGQVHGIEAEQFGIAIEVVDIGREERHDPQSLFRAVPQHRYWAARTRENYQLGMDLGQDLS
jgi:hypothetical protein